MRRKRHAKTDPRQLMLFTDEEMLGTEAEEVTAVEATVTTPRAEPEAPQLMEGKELVVDLLRSVMQLLDHFADDDIRLIAMQSAALVQRGIDYSSTYRLPAVPGYEFKGDVLAGLAYVSIARSFPNMTASIGLHWEEAYREAVDTYLNS